MESEDVMRLQYISQANLQCVAYQAELHTMLVANKERELKGESLAYDEDDFARLNNAITETIRNSIY